MNKFLLAFLTLNILFYWDLLIKLRYIFNRKDIERWLDTLFHRICNLLFKLTSFLVNVHIHFERADGIELPNTFMLIANHQSIQDIPLLIWAFPDHDLRFCAKDSLFRGIPTVSIMLRLQKHGKINRHGGSAETMKTIERVALKSRDGYCPVIFPEGTRSKDGKIGTFHHGAVRKILNENSIPVVTVAIEGGWRVGDTAGLIRNMSNFDYHVKILEIFDEPKSKNEIQNLIEKASSDIKKQVYCWQKDDLDHPKIEKGHHIKPY